MVKISAETFAKNCFYNLIDKEKNSWLENKDIKERLGVQNIYDLVHKEIKGKFETKNPTMQQNREYKRDGSESTGSEKYVYTHEDIIIRVIMSCRVSTSEAIKFRSELAFKQHDIVLSKEQSVLSKILELFSNGKMQLQHSCLDQRTDLYFLKHKSVVEIDQKGYTNRDERKEKIEKELGFKFIRGNPDKNIFSEYVKFGEINNQIKN